MTTQRQSQAFNPNTDHEKIRRLFERFSKAHGEEKKEVAREMMDHILMRPQA